MKKKPDSGGTLERALIDTTTWLYCLYMSGSVFF